MLAEEEIKRRVITCTATTCCLRHIEVKAAQGIFGTYCFISLAQFS